MKVGYVINQYPKVTHTFVRTELCAVEATGIEIERLAIRRADSPLIDAADLREAERTRTVLDLGLSGLAMAILRTAVGTPAHFACALRTAVQLGWRSHRGIALHLAYLAEACVLARWARDLGVDHLHAHFGSNPTSVVLLCRRLGGPTYSFTVHGPEDFEYANLLSIPEKVEQAAFVAVVSEAGRMHLQQWCAPHLWDRMHLVRCGIDPRFRDRPPLPAPSARRIVFVGRLCPAKAPLLLVEAVARLKATGEECDLVMIGDGPLRAAIEERIGALGLADRVQLLGWASGDEVERRICEARVLALPSFAEGLPIVLMESLALHRPVICTPVGGIAELVEDGVCGWVVPPGSLDALTGALRAALAASPEELARMGREGAARVARQHDITTAARTLAALFEARSSTASHATHEYGPPHPALSR